MAITGEQVEELLRELQQSGIDYSAPGARGRAIDIISALEADPNLTLADVLPPEENQPPPLPQAPPQSATNVPSPGSDGVATLTGQENRPQTMRPVDRRQQFIDAFGVAPDAPDFQSQVWRNFAHQAIPQVVGTALGGAGGLIAKAAQVAPRLTTAGLGAIGSILMPGRTGNAEAQGRSPPSEEVRQLQSELQRRGYYRGPMDGVMGPATQEANQRFQADEQARRQQELDAGRVQADQDRARAEAEAARARQQEAQQRREAEERRARERETGNQRVQEMERDLSPFSRFVRDWSEPLGYALGVGAGFLTRGTAVSASNARSRALAARADARIQDASRRGIDRQVGAVNQTWAEGQRAGQSRAPFEVTPDAPLGFRANPAGSPPASSLYQPPPSRMGNTTVDAGIATGFGIESGLSMWMGSRAHAERDAAQAAVGQDSTEANIRRLQAARDNVAFWDGLAAFGRTGAATHLGLGAKMVRTPTRPDVERAEAMQMSLSRRLGAAAPPARAPPEGGARSVAPRQSEPSASSADRPPSGAYFSHGENRWIINTPGGRRYLAGSDRWRDYIPPE